MKKHKMIELNRNGMPLDAGAKSNPEVSDPKREPVEAIKPNLIRRTAEGVKNLSIKEIVATGTMASVALGGVFLLGHNEGARSTERPPAAAPAVPGVNQAEKANESDPFKYELSGEQVDRLDSTVKANVLEALQVAEEADDFKEGEPNLYTYTDASGKHKAISIDTKPALKGYEVTFRDDYYSSGASKESKHVFITFTTPNQVDDPKNTLENDLQLTLTQFYEADEFENDPEKYFKITEIENGIVTSSDNTVYTDESGESKIDYRFLKDKGLEQAVDRIFGYGSN